MPDTFDGCKVGILLKEGGLTGSNVGGEDVVAAAKEGISDSFSDLPHNLKSFKYPL